MKILIIQILLIVLAAASTLLDLLPEELKKSLNVNVWRAWIVTNCVFFFIVTALHDHKEKIRDSESNAANQLRMAYKIDTASIDYRIETPINANRVISHTYRASEFVHKNMHMPGFHDTLSSKGLSIGSISKTQLSQSEIEELQKERPNYESQKIDSSLRVLAARQGSKLNSFLIAPELGLFFNRPGDNYFLNWVIEVNIAFCAKLQSAGDYEIESLFTGNPEAPIDFEKCDLFIGGDSSFLADSINIKLLSQETPWPQVHGQLSFRFYHNNVKPTAADYRQSLDLVSLTDLRGAKGYVVITQKTLNEERKATELLFLDKYKLDGLTLKLNNKYNLEISPEQISYQEVNGAQIGIFSFPEKLP